MTRLNEGDLLWTPSAADLRDSRIAQFMRWLAEHAGQRFDDYPALWAWSVESPEAFWRAVIDYHDIPLHGDRTVWRTGETMPDVHWFPQAQLNYVERVFQMADATRPAIVHAAEGRPVGSMSWDELRARTAAFADTLRELGVTPGDRVAAYLPNVPETIVAFLGCAAVGAVWSLCSPDMGEGAVRDRFVQIAPKVLVAATGGQYHGKPVDRLQTVTRLLEAMPDVQALIHLRLGDGPSPGDSLAGRPVRDFATDTRRQVALTITPVSFEHPLWVVYSSGTTGLPKPIMHGHGGVVLEHVKMIGLHLDIGPHDRFNWYASTGWIMWNVQVGGLLIGATLALYDGSPAWPAADALWRFVEQAGVTFFGAGAAYFAQCMKQGIDPRRVGGFEALRSIGSTGSPLSVDAYGWLQSTFGPHAWIVPISGGTDFAGAFVGGVRTLPVHAGVMQCRCLGASVEAWNEQGQALDDAVGELVCTRPMPSMPIGFWGDPDGKRLRESYFEMFPGVWRHGDWIRITHEGGAVIYGRSDSTINRHGVRIGTSDLYRAVESVPQIMDAMVVDLEYLDRPSCLMMFVVLREGDVLDAGLTQHLRDVLRREVGPRFIPDEIHALAALPRTLSGKKMELPVRKLLLGFPPEQCASRDAMAEPAAFDALVQFARQRAVS